MTAASFIGSLTSGHGCHPPQTITDGSSDTIINNIGAARVTDPVSVHNCGDNTHGGSVSSGESSVKINSLDAANIGGGVSCGGVVAQGSSDTFIGT